MTTISTAQPGQTVTVLPDALPFGSVEDNGHLYIEVVRGKGPKRKWVAAAELDLITAVLRTGEPQEHISLEDGDRDAVYLIFARGRLSRMWLSPGNYTALLAAITAYQQSEPAPVLEPAA
jgi:hypothetical protein